MLLFQVHTIERLNAISENRVLEKLFSVIQYFLSLFAEILLKNRMNNIMCVQQHNISDLQGDCMKPLVPTPSCFETIV